MDYNPYNLYNPELEMMRWRLQVSPRSKPSIQSFTNLACDIMLTIVVMQVLAMGLQHQHQASLPGPGHPLPFVPFHLQSGPQPAPGLNPGLAQPLIKSEPRDPEPEAGSSPPSLLYRPAFQTRPGSVSPRSSSPSSSDRSSPSPTRYHIRLL